MDSSLEQKISDIYISNLDIISEGFPQQVNRDRRLWAENINLQSFPSVQDERYRHFNVRRLLDIEWEQFFTPPARDVNTELPLRIDGYRIVLGNGFHMGAEPLSMLNNGIVYGSLKSAMRYMPDVVLKHYNSVADNENDTLTAINSLFMQDGAFIYIPEGVKSTDPFIVYSEYESSELSQLCFERLLIVAEKDARADIFVWQHSEGDARIIVDSVREVILNVGSEVTVNELNTLSASTVSISGKYTGQSSASKFSEMSVMLSGESRRVNNRVELQGPGCESNFYGLYCATGQELVDVNMNMNHNSPDCESSQLLKGIVAGESVGSFTGKVYVKQDAQRTAAYQQSRNLQLSEGAHVYTEPQLEIYADDVKCSHGATVGQMDDDAVYYMRQRGISESDARKLQMSGFVNDIISRCSIEPACSLINEMAEKRLKEL